MKKTITTIVSALMLLFVGAAVAQDEEDSGMTWVPVEGWTCDYNDGKGRADLDAVIAEWNDWLDGKDVDDYFATVMTPNYYGERAFDVAWLGAWRNGDAMGALTDIWVNEGGEMAGKFFEVLTCGAHTNFAAANVKQPPEDDDGAFVATFTNCSTKEGKSFEDYLAAQKEWNAYADENGFAGGAWVFLPIYGETDDSYEFKIVGSTPDHSTLGHNWQLYSEGHFNKSEELFGPVLDCDSARVYDATVVRELADEDG